MSLRFMFAVAAALLVSGCAICLPLLYKPTYDPGPLVSSLRVPEKIESISDIPRDRTIFSGGVSRESGRSSADIKEMFEIKKGAEYGPGTIYQFILYYNEETAKRDFDSRKNVPFVPSYFTGGSGDRAYAILYIMRDQRGDTGFWGFCEPSRDYHSIAIFRFGNLLVEIAITETENHANSMTKAIHHLIALLEKEWGPGTRETR